MDKVYVPRQLTYCAVFLTFSCRFKCPYCINRYGHLKQRKPLTGREWIEGLNRLQWGRDLMVPITIQGGEPSRHPEWMDIINGLDERFYIDLLTNLDFDIAKFMQTVSADKIQRKVPYACIRVSYHPGQHELADICCRVRILQQSGYSIGLFSVAHPETDIVEIMNTARKYGIDFRTKEFLGEHDGQMFGVYKYPDAVAGGRRVVDCRSTELLIAPDGNIHRCHSDLYSGHNPIGNIMDDDLEIKFPYRYCDRYGECSPCDIKVKNNRFQQYGACSVSIRQVSN